MRFIPTKFHAPLNSIVGVALIAAPVVSSTGEPMVPPWAPQQSVNADAATLRRAAR